MPCAYAQDAAEEHAALIEASSSFFYATAALVDDGAAANLMAAALKRLARDSTPQHAAQAWRGTGLSLLSYLPAVCGSPSNAQIFTIL